MKITIDAVGDEFKRIAHCDDAFDLLLEIDHKCRNILKYHEPSEETAKVLEEIREMIHEDNLLDLWQ